MGEATKYFLICKLLFLQAADPWLWLAGLAVCREREGVPLPRSGGGREGADVSQTPYKHRLAYAPGNRPLVFRAGVPVRRGLGVYPKSLLGLGPPTGRKTRWGEEGAPQRGGLPGV